jgi:hypothetical protein
MLLFILSWLCTSGASASQSPPWTNPNPVGNHFPAPTDPDATFTPGTPDGCDPMTFLREHAQGDALNNYFSSPDNLSGPKSTIKKFFNGHPLSFGGGKILFPVGVGKTDASRLIAVFEFEKKMSRATTSGAEDQQDFQYCTSYFNEGNTAAQQDFQFHYIPTDLKGRFKNPNDPKNAEKLLKTRQAFNAAFADLLPRFLECEETFGYYAFGCQSAFERTPTLLAMLLKEAGCSTENSVFIADMILGSNTIPVETRKAIVSQTPLDPADQHAVWNLLFGTN